MRRRAHAAALRILQGFCKNCNCGAAGRFGILEGRRGHPRSGGKGAQKNMLIQNAHAVTPGRDLGRSSIRVAGDRIVDIGAGLAPAPGEEVVAADGLLALPGFVDIHTHGRSGCDFCDLTDAAFDTMGRDRLKDGVTGFLATGLTRPEADLAALCRCAERYKARGAGATCLGVHA